MVHVKAEADELTVCYHNKEQWIAGGVFLVFCILFGLASYGVLRAPPDAKMVFVALVLVVTSCVLGYHAWLAIRRGFRRVKHPVWLLRFTPSDVRLNLQDPDHVRPGRETMDTALVIPLAEIAWLRKTTKPGAWTDEPDEIYVEMAVSDRAFEIAAQRRSDVRQAPEGRCAMNGATVMRLFEGNVIRVFLERGRWPQEITDFWAVNGYRVAAPFTLEEPVDLASAKAHPQELL